MKKLLCILAKLFFYVIAFTQICPDKSIQPFCPDAGLMPSLTDNPDIVITSSSGVRLNEIVDGDETTHWVSTNPIPFDFVARGDQNIFINNSLVCTASNLVGNCSAVNDLDYNSSVKVNAHQGVASLTLTFPFTQLIGISVKIGGSEPITIIGIDRNNVEEIIGIYSIETGKNYTFQFFNTFIFTAKALRFESIASFEFFEIGALANSPKEYIIIDFKKLVDVSQIYTKHYSGVNSAGKATAERIKVFLSQDSLDWHCVGDLEPEPTQIIATDLITTECARYIKIEYQVVPQPDQKVWFFEIDAYGEMGRYGDRPAAQPSKVTVAELLGINGLYGWGTGRISSEADGGSPERYRPVATHARNYHFMDFDAIEVIQSPPMFAHIADPDLPPYFENMLIPQRAFPEPPIQKPLVNWLLEYNEWSYADLSIQACITFHQLDAKGDKWDQIFDDQGYLKSARRYGQAFAKYFGPSSAATFDGEKYFSIPVVEVGNEPWRYDAKLYKNILQGMAQGLKETDPQIKVLPCALQAADKDVEVNIEGITKNYMGARIKESTLPKLDGLNIHLYSYITNPLGKQLGTYPEHKNSTFNEVHNAIRWRDHNLPNKPIYCTEWGWDHDSPNTEPCLNDECVSENAAAAYATRGALLLLRLGVERASWYFYGDTEPTITHPETGLPYTSRYWRSGLTGSVRTSFAKKRSFYALESLMKIVGDKKFLYALQEDETAWVYVLGDNLQTPTHLVAWRPTDGDNTSLIELDVLGNFIPISAVQLNGESGEGTAVESPKYKKDRMNIKVGTIPIIIEVTPCSNCPDVVIVSPKVFLQGTYQTSNSLMSDALRAAELIPALEATPSTDALGVRTVHPRIFKTSTHDAIVDAVSVELRSSADPSIILASRSAFVQRDGDVVDIDGISPITFYGFAPDSYYVAIKHRNHLGIMTQAPVRLSGW
jgi:hypothetical protein